MNWKGQAIGVVVHSVLPAVATVLTLAWARRPGRETVRLPGVAACAVLFLLTRLVFAPILYGPLGLYGYFDYLHWVRTFADPVLEGARPGLDFRNGYAPLFPWLVAGGKGLAGAGWGVLLPFIAGDALCVFGGARLAGRLLGEASVPGVRCWLLLSPLLWYQGIVWAQDEPLFLGLLVAAGLLALGGSGFASGCLLGFGLCATKITFLVYAGVVLAWMWIGGRRRWTGPAGFALVSALVIVWYTSRGAPAFSYNFDRHLQQNIPFGLSFADLVRRYTGALPLEAVTLARGGVVAAGLVGVAVAWWARRLRPADGLVLSLAAAHSVLGLMVPAFLTPYLTQGFLFQFLVALRRGDAPEARAVLWILPVAAFTAGLAWQVWWCIHLSNVLAVLLCIATLWAVRRRLAEGPEEDAAAAASVTASAAPEGAP